MDTNTNAAYTINELRRHRLGDSDGVLAGAATWATTQPARHCQLVVEVTRRDRTEGTFETIGPMDAGEARLMVADLNANALHDAHGAGTIHDADGFTWAVETMGGRIVKAERYPAHDQAVTASRDMARIYGARCDGALYPI